MRILDLHADLGCDIAHKHKNNETDVLKRDHLPGLMQGEITVSACACFFDGSAGWEDMKHMIRASIEELKDPNLHWIKERKDLDGLDEKPSFFLTVEGMCGIERDLEDRIAWLKKQGVCIASLCWNEQNALATGVGGDPARGLSEKGRKAVRALEKNGILLDVSHANEHTFWDCITVAKKPVLATHSNCRALCDVSRNLSDEQIIAIAEGGGLIGLNAYGPFIAKEKKAQTVQRLAEHAKHIAGIAGAHAIACGFDFMDYFDPTPGTKGLSSACMAQNLVQALLDVGFSQEEVQWILYENAMNFLKNNL